MMKKILYIFCIALIGLGCIFNITPVKANAVNVNVTLIEPTIKANLYRDGVLAQYSILGYIHVNGETAYCVEPYKRINSGDVVIESSQLNEAVKQQLSIISYNGYNQSNQHSDKWYAATQLMIWEALGITFDLEGFDDYATYRQQIQERINLFHILPSFNQHKLTLKKDELKTLQDNNQVLKDYASVNHHGSANVTRDDSSLKMLTHSNKYEEGTISYQRLDDQMLGLPIVYRGISESIQSIIYPKISENIKGQLTYRVQPYGSLQLVKTGNQLTSVDLVDTEDGPLYQLQFSEGSLNNVKANIYAREDIYDVWGNLVYAKDTFIEQLISGKKEESIALLSGKYYLKEIETLKGYVLDDKEYDFTIANDKEEFDIITLALNNQRAKVNLHLQKYFEEGSLLDLSDAYKDVIIAVYTKNDIQKMDGDVIVKANSMIYRSGIDAQGNLLKEMDLPLGDYYLKELHTNQHFVLDENTYHFSVEANGKANIDIRINDGKLVNKLHRNHLVIHKIGNNKVPLQAKFVLYDTLMNEICEFMSDKEGEYEFTNLVDGTYFLQEIEAPQGYKLNSKLHKIELSEDKTYTVKNVKNVVNPSIETRDLGNHQRFEFSMLGSMIAVYGLVIRKLSKI